MTTTASQLSSKSSIQSGASSWQAADHQARAPNREPDDSGKADRRKGGNGRLGSAGWQHQLEERDGVAPLLLPGAHRAVDPACQQAGAFREQEGDARPEGRRSPPPKDAGPDVAERGELRHRP